MKISTLIATTILGLSLAPASFANLAPTSCPEVSAIQGAGFDLVGQMEDGTGKWGALKLKETYKTPNDWTFALLYITAKDSNEAMQIALASLAKLDNPAGPIRVDTNEWACFYNVNDNEESAIAVTPSVNARLSSFAAYAKSFK